MKVLVLGSGGREHAIVWKINQNPEVEKIYCIPGNGGIAELAECHSLSLSDFDAISKFVQEKGIDFTIVGPEQPLVEGIVDHFQSRGLSIFGPSKQAAQMEGSKIFAKRLLQKYDIPTATYEEFDDPNVALSYLDMLQEQPLVVKADGLAGGKGSIVCPDIATAKKAVDSLMNIKIFKDAGARILIEEFMTGPEVSLFVLTDGKDYVILSPAQDFKRALDNDKGKNTGGMGSYAPTPFLTSELYQRSIREIVEPTLHALQSEGIDYRGVLYCGLMLTPTGPKVVEFNCRFGDPETQVVLPLLESDLLELLLAVEKQELSKVSVMLKPDYAVCVVLASGGYPDFYEKDKEITGLDSIPENVIVFHAGTYRKNG
ncbi:MAG: phosphoribosylamine--glycine ligase, partial [Calditrichaeota bacterium]